MRYVEALLDAVPMLSRLIVNRTSESVELSTRIVIEIHTASFRAIRGYTVVAAICDEIGFWRDETSANPDAEILAALRPGMSTVPGALLLAISSPYARRGALWEAYRQHYGVNGDAVLVWQAPTRAMNPGVDAQTIRDAYARDAHAASAEYGAEFRRDVEAYVTHEAVDAVTAPGRVELPPLPDVCWHVAFVDPSGGAHDSMTLAVAHVEGDVAVLDLVAEQMPPFSPEAVVEAFAELLARYDVRALIGDRYGGAWPAERFRARGIEYVVSPLAKSDLYRDLLPAINSGQVRLLDHARLRGQLLALERRTGRSGRDAIDHPPGAHDDVANAAAGALVLAKRAVAVEPVAVEPTEDELARLRAFMEHPGEFWGIPEHEVAGSF
jgi:hypothetical protein